MTIEPQENNNLENQDKEEKPLVDEFLEGEFIHKPTTSEQRPYVRDDLFKELLSSYQNADWEKSLKILKELIKLYPEEPSLLDFEEDIKMRSKLHKLGSESQKAETRLKIGQLSGWLIAGGIAVILLFFLVRWGIDQFQTSQKEQRLSIEATAEARMLNTKYENAEGYLTSGRPSQALEVYEEIDQISPGYLDVAQKIIISKDLIEREAEYQEALEYYQQGDLEKAAEILESIYNYDPSFKDVNRLLTSIENELNINQLIEEIHQAFQQGEWESLITSYEQIKEIDITFSQSEIEEELFIGFMNLIILIADQPDASLEDITRAEEYYRSALALFPQSREYALEREELERVATNLIVNKLYIYAVSLLETENYSLQAIQEAIKILSRASNIDPGSPTIGAEKSLAQTFLNGYNAFANHNYDDSIIAFDNLLRAEPGYAGGIVRYLLYEAHVARGDLFASVGEFSSAREDYEVAETYAWGEGGSKLQLFQVEVRIGFILRRLSLYEESSEYFHFAATLIDLQKYLDPTQTEVVEAFRNAQIAYARGQEWEVSRLYDYVYQEANYIFPTETIRAFRGDSLVHLAFRYGSTLDFIRDLNNLGNAMESRLDQDIQIPYLEGDE